MFVARHLRPWAVLWVGCAASSVAEGGPLAAGSIGEGYTARLRVGAAHVELYGAVQASEKKDGSFSIAAASGGSGGGAMHMATSRSDFNDGQDRPFCGDWRGQSNYTGGFVSVFSSERSSRACINFLFVGVDLDSSEKFVLGCWFTLAVGIIIEGLLALSQRLSWSTWCTITIKLLLHSTTIILGYALMLLVMSYSVELTLCAVTGLCVGRLIFQGWLGRWHHSNPEANAEDDKRTPCCTD